MQWLCLLFLLCASSLLAEDPSGHSKVDFHSSSMHWHGASKILQRIPLRGYEKVLLLECREGQVAASLAAQLPAGRVVAIDEQSEVIQAAKELYLPAVTGNLSFEKMAIQELSGEGLFDLVAGIDSCNWLANSDEQGGLETIYRLLKPRGRFVASLFQGLPLSMQKILDELVVQPRWSDYFADFSAGWPCHSSRHLLVSISELGFEPIRIEQTCQRERFTSRDLFKEFMGQWLVHCAVLPMELRDRFLEELIDRYLIEDASSISRGQIFLELPRLEVELFKGDGQLDLMACPELYNRMTGQSSFPMAPPPPIAPRDRYRR